MEENSKKPCASSAARKAASSAGVRVRSGSRTGPQSMPVFNDANITSQEKRDIIAFIRQQGGTQPGGLSLGSLGPVTEGLWAWVVGIGLLIGAAVWIGAKSS